MNNICSFFKRICTLLVVFGLVAGIMPATAWQSLGVLVANAATETLELDNGYIKVTVSSETGGFGIRTVAGDKINKSDDDRYLVFEYDEDNTSFTSFQVTRNGQVKEYIFGGKYPGSSDVTVSRSGEELIAVWSVDGLTFRQTISLVDTGSTEHGTALISYSVENAGQPADIKCRVLMDTALGYQDYAYYNVGRQFLQNETALDADGYQKSFYGANNPTDPTIVAYTINASVNNEECKPYRTVFAHWSNLASTVFDYTPDETMYFTNANNLQYRTSDSAYALYFDMGQVQTGNAASVGTHYGIYSNESVSADASMAINVNAPDVLEFAKDASGKEDQSAYENGGVFSVKTYIENISEKDYSKLRIVIYAAGGIDPLDESGERTNSTYEAPYSVEMINVTSGKNIEMDWEFYAEPQEVGQYAKVHYKIYDVCDEATQSTGALMAQNLLGEGYSYILCPGSVEKIPAIKFTGSSPETIYSSGLRNLYVTGQNFSMLLDTSTYRMMLSRVDGNPINGQSGVQIPTTQFQIDDSTNVMTVILSEDAPGTLAEGMYQLTLDYNDTTKTDISGQALRFHVSNDVKFKNDAYGYLAVIKNHDNTYTIKRFASEDEYWTDVEAGRVDRNEVLLEFQGSYIKQDTDDGSAVYSGVSLGDSDNVMTLNGCLDIKNGTVTVTEKDGSVTVDFDAELYTTGSGTHVWDGMCALTELEAGTEYSLIRYSENGDRLGCEGESIALLWPSVGQGFQSLMGLLFEFKYGEMGVIAHEQGTGKGAETRLLAFGAAMDLSFLIPESISNNIVLGGKTKYTKDALGSSWDAAEHNSIQWTPAEIRALNKQADMRAQAAKTDATADDVAKGQLSDMTVDDTPGFNALSIVVDDVLFGGEYLGVNMAVGLGLPAYIDGLPAMEVLLDVHTVGDWSFGVDGQCHFASFSMEVEIEIMSKNDIPVPNKLTFFMGGITPGINVDGVGVLWLQGGGGGIDNLYDTIFLTESVPPLKLILQAQFSIMQVFSATASLGLSLQGIDVSLTNGRLSDHTDESSGTVIEARPITMDASASLYWYPEFYLMGAVNLDLATIVQGGGYVVADAQGFYEFFLRAAVSVPSDVPIFGGIHIAQMNMGVNTSKLWGQASFLDLSVGITYYWGGDIDWNSGSTVYPTYPELVGMDGGDAAVAMALEHDVRNSRTLFMLLGTNVRQASDKLQTDVSSTSLHTMQLTNNGNSRLLTIQWPAESYEKAAADAAQIMIVNEYSSRYAIKQMDNAYGADSQENANANANLTYDEAEGTALLAVSFTKADAFGPTWTIYTPEGAQLVLYDVAPLPEIAADTVQVTDSTLTATISGSKPDAFTTLTLFAQEKNTGNSLLLGQVQNPFAGGNQSIEIQLPAQMSGGDYTLRLVASDENDRYYSEAEATFTYTNPNEPAAPTNVSAAGAGNYTAAITVGDGAGEDFDGYIFTAYDEAGNPVSGVTELAFYKDGTSVSYNDDGTIAASESSNAASTFYIGGHYEQTQTDEETGQQTTLVAGFSAGEYTVTVRRWKAVADGAAMLCSAPVTIPVTVNEPVKTEVSVSVATAADGASGQTAMTRGDGSTYMLDTYTSGDVILQLTTETEAITGTWRLDGGIRAGTAGQVTAPTKRISLPFTDLKDGTHTLHFLGKNPYGDSVSLTYQFCVDTQGPRLLIAQPVNGSLFDYWTGVLTVSGVTDAGTRLSVTDNTTGKTVYTADSAAQLDAGGKFTFDVTLDRTVLSHDLTITAMDPMGNKTSRNVSVMSNGLGSIEKLMLYANGKDVTNTELTAGASYSMTLMAKLERPANATAEDEDLYVQLNAAGMVDWVQTIAEGTGEITETSSGTLMTTSPDAEGMITANFLVSTEGVYPVSAAFGFTGDQVISLDSDYTQIVTTDQLYTGSAVTTTVEVWYKGTRLTENVDYIIGEYTNNVDVTTDDVKAQVKITGIGTYSGTVTGSFEIEYLASDALYSVSGVEGTNGWYLSDVAVVPAEGYETVLDGESVQITLEENGTHSVQFRVRRISDGAMTDTVTLTIPIDQTAPTGTITLEQSGWSTFLDTITFGLYKLESMSAEVAAEDENGIAKIEYAVSEAAYSSATELEAGVTWKDYSDIAKPTLRQDKNQVIYVKLTDNAGNVSYISSDGIHADTIAPEAAVVINADTATSSSLSFTFSSTEAGKYYYAVLDATATAPDAAAVMTQQVIGAVMGSGNIPADMAGQPITLTVSSLNPNTVYVVYLVTEDATISFRDGTPAGNISALAVSAAASTKLAEYVIAGDATWQRGSDQDLTFTVDGPFNEFTELRIDGVVVDPEGYIMDAVNMTVSITPAVLEKLEDGSHTVDIIYANGTACGSFRILPNSVTPPTGDQTNIVLWAAPMFLSAIGLVVLLLFLGKQKKKFEEA